MSANVVRVCVLAVAAICAFRVTSGFSSAADATQDPFVGVYQGTFHPQGWSAGSGRKARPDKVEEVEALEHKGIDPKTLSADEFFAAYVAAETSPAGDAGAAKPAQKPSAEAAAYGDAASTSSAMNSESAKPAKKAHRCAACHAVATVERAEAGYQLTFLINHGNDKDGKLIKERRTIPGAAEGLDKVVFHDQKFTVTLADGKLSGRHLGRMTGKIDLHRQTPAEAEKEALEAAASAAVVKPAAAAKTATEANAAANEKASSAAPAAATSTPSAAGY